MPVFEIIMIIIFSIDLPEVPVALVDQTDLDREMEG